MKTPAHIALGMLIGISIAKAENLNFDRSETGGAPVGWTAAVTGQGESRWTVEKDATAPSAPNVLKQSAVGTFPICLLNGTRIQNGFAEVKFKAVSGKKDQAGGVIWRAQDKNNYYLARANALEDNVTIYHVIQGKRVSFENAEIKVAPAQWHTLRVDFTGDQFTVLLNGKIVLTARDNKLKNAGQVGLWTKADSVTLFDDFSFASK